MKFVKLLLLLTLGLTLGTLPAQDVHFSLYNMAPLSINPALTGAYQGTARVGGIYRSQWSSFLAQDLFATPSFYIDAPLFRGFRKTDWIGVGMLTVNDKAGDAQLRTTINMLSLSYHMALNKTGKTMLTIGLQGGSVQRKLDLNADGVTFGDELLSGLGGGQPIQSQDRGLGESKNYLDFGIGLMLRNKMDEKSDFEIGFSYNHLTQPKYGFTTDATDPDANKRPAKIILHGTYNSKLTEKISIAPTFLFQNTGGASEAVLQGWGGYQLNKAYKLNFGLGYRFGDAGQLLLGADIEENLRVAASIDVNTSSLNTATNYGGGFEIAAYYIFKLYKKPNVKPALLCPRI